MAAVTPTNSIAYGFSTPAGPKTTGQATPTNVKTCYFACAFTGTYAQGTGFSITSAQIQTAIGNELRNGGTYTIWDVSAVAPGQEGTGNSWVMPGQVAFTSTSGPATGLLYGSDMSTEHAAQAMSSFGSPCVFAVTFLDSAL